MCAYIFRVKWYTVRIHDAMARSGLEKKFLRRRFTRKGKSSIATTNLLAQKIWSNDFFKICYHAGGSTEHLPRPKMKRRNEESPPSDTSTPKKRKPRLAGEIMTYLLTCPLTLTPPQPHLLSPCLCKIKMLWSSKMAWIVTIRTTRYLLYH